MYEFAHRRKLFNSNPEWMGVVHGDNVPYDIGLPLLPKFYFGFDTADRNVSLFIMATYANFAKSCDLSASGVTWDRYNSSHRAYLRVDAKPKMAASFYPRRMAFWNDYHPKLVEVKLGAEKEVVSGTNPSVTMGRLVQIAIGAILAILLKHHALQSRKNLLSGSNHVWSEALSSLSCDLPL